MKVNIEQLKEIQAYLEMLSNDGIDMPDEGGYLGEKDYDELPDEMEIDEIRLDFPDDQGVFDIEPELFLEYMREINSLRRVNGVIVRTDHIIQATISSARVGFTSFEEAITSYTFEGDGIDVRVLQKPFLVGVMNAKEGRFNEDYGAGACELYTAIEIRIEEGKDELNVNELIERICFYLTDKTGVAVYPWEGPDFNELDDAMSEYYDGEEEYEDEESEDDEQDTVELSTLPHFSPLLKMYRLAKEVNDPEIQFLQYYKMIEYVSPVVAKSVAYEHLNKRLDMLPRISRDHKYLDSILAVARKYDKDLRDDTLALAAIENCVDVVPLYEMLPKRMLKKVKGTLKLQKDSLTDEDINDEQLIGLQKQIAGILYATRNSIVHAKSNYVEIGNELKAEELEEANDMMDVIAHSIINWNERQPEGFRV